MVCSGGLQTEFWYLKNNSDKESSFTVLKGKKSKHKCLRAGNICWKWTTSPHPSTNKKWFCEPWNSRSLFFSGLPLCAFPVVWCFGWACIASCLSAYGLLVCPSSDRQPAYLSQNIGKLNISLAFLLLFGLAKLSDVSLSDCRWESAWK